jgi:hypothetical protein
MNGDQREAGGGDKFKAGFVLVLKWAGNFRKFLLQFVVSDFLEANEVAHLNPRRQHFA